MEWRDKTHVVMPVEEFNKLQERAKNCDEYARGYVSWQAAVEVFLEHNIIVAEDNESVKQRLGELLDEYDGFKAAFRYNDFQRFLTDLYKAVCQVYISSIPVQAQMKLVLDRVKGMDEERRRLKDKLNKIRREAASE